MNDNIQPLDVSAAKDLTPPEIGSFITLQMAQDPDTSEVHMGLAAIPIDLRYVRELQDALGEDMAAENMKFVIVKDRAFLVPIQTSSLITLK